MALIEEHFLMNEYKKNSTKNAILFELISAETLKDKKITFENFKIFKNKINLIYGTNGTGKTSLAIAFSQYFKNSKTKFPKNWEEEPVFKNLDLKLNDVSKFDSYLIFTEKNEINLIKRGQFNNIQLAPKTLQKIYQNKIHYKKWTNFFNKEFNNFHKNKNKIILKIDNNVIVENNFSKKFLKSCFDNEAKKFKFLKIFWKDIKQFLSKELNWILDFHKTQKKSSTFVNNWIENIKKSLNILQNLINKFFFVAKMLDCENPSKLIKKTDKEFVLKTPETKNKSSGEQTKKSLINIMLDPILNSQNSLIVLDDPSVFLDLKNRHEFINNLLFLTDLFSTYNEENKNESLTFIIFTHSHEFVREIKGNFENDQLFFQIMSKSENKVNFKDYSPTQLAATHERGRNNMFKRLLSKEKIAFSLKIVDFFSTLIMFLNLINFNEEEIQNNNNKLWESQWKNFKKWKISFKNFKYLLETFYSHGFLTKWWESNEFIETLKKKMHSNVFNKEFDNSKEDKSEFLFDLIYDLSSEFIRNNDLIFPELVPKNEFPKFLDFQQILKKEQQKTQKKDEIKKRTNYSIQEKINFYLIFSSEMRITLERTFFEWAKKNKKIEIPFFSMQENYFERIKIIMNKIENLSLIKKYEIYCDFIKFGYFLNFHKHNFFYNSLNMERDFDNIYKLAIEDFHKVLKKYKITKNNTKTELF